MDHLLVIKVTNGDSLRRITLDPDEKGDLHLNMDRLRARILSLFKFDPDADLTLTYIDEDNDIITLIDEDDIYDALQQPLNPLRITAKLNSCSSYSAPRAPQFQQHTISDILSQLSKFIESVTEPLCDTLNKLVDSMISTATFSVPALTELVECLSKLELTRMGPYSQCQANASFNTQSSTSDSDVKVKQDTISTPKVFPSDEIIDLTLENNQRGLENENTNKDVETLFPSNIAPFNPNPILPKDVEDIWGSFPIIISRSIFMDCLKKTKEIHGTFADSDCNNEIPSGFSPEDTCPTIAKNEMHGFDVVSLSGNHFTTPWKANYQFDCSRGGKQSHLGIQCHRSKACSIIGPQLKLNSNHKQLQHSLGQLNQTDSGLKRYTKKIDSLFIQDIQVIDGTLMKPATCFTKIWRMRNNGNVVWPQGIQLTWIGGNQFTEKVSVEIQVPGDGLHVDDELDIAVDFTTPDQPGRYTSYWRMTLPSGHKFGQVIWVDIKVDTTPKDNSTDRFYRMRSSSFSKGSKEKGKENVDVQVQSLNDNLVKFGPYCNMGTELPMQCLDDESRNKQKLHSSSSTNKVALPGTFNITIGLAKQLVHDQTCHNQKLPSCSRTNVSKASEQDNASNVSKLNESKKLEETRFNKIDKMKKNNISSWCPILEKLELKGCIDAEQFQFEFLDRQDRKMGSGKPNRKKGSGKTKYRKK